MLPAKKVRIVIASVLKPVNDTRMFEKFAMTIAERTSSEVHVIGYPAVMTGSPVQIHALPPFGRLSSRRAAIPFTVLRKLRRIKPDIIIVTTHELLSIAALYKIFSGCRIIYDVQENYARNILYTNSFPVMQRPILAMYVRCKELLLSLFIHHFILAEKSYAQELNFIGKRFTIIENKVRADAVRARREHTAGNRLIFTGTLAENTGVYTAIEIALKLHGIDRSVTLRIVGYCATEEELFKIINTIEPYPFIELIGGKTLVPHEKIMEQVAQADFGIVSYKINPSTSGSIPTKLYEYLGARLPIILVRHQPWIEIASQYGSAILFDPGNPDASSIYDQMKHGVFYTKNPENVFWDSEIPKLLSVLTV